jgi:hypothetical protein
MFHDYIVVTLGHTVLAFQRITHHMNRSINEDDIPIYGIDVNIVLLLKAHETNVWI